LTHTEERDHAQIEAIRRTLRAVREHLGLDVAFVSQFVDDRRVFLHVDTGAHGARLEVGTSGPLEGSYCHYVTTGKLPQFLPDPKQHPVSAALPVTAELPVGTHLSVPIRFSDGRIYGTFCCFAHDVRLEIEPADLRAVEMVAALVADYLEDLERRKADKRRRRDAIEGTIHDPHGLTIVFQPLVDIVSNQIVAVEALSRFANGTGPERLFADAFDVGLGVPLELKSVAAALREFDQIPPDIRLNVNVSPDTLISGPFADMLTVVPADRLVVEVTEHAAIRDQPAVKAARERLSALGIRISIDDVGAGFSGLSRILDTGADELKMDRAIVHNVDVDPVKQAMIDAFVGFCERTGFGLVAEGIETADELATLRSLGVALGQGYEIARPGPLDVLFAPAGDS
jgi:EAL domain-containing protein (putative c-di-GMP-specific phosphodiesterase class I)